MTCFLGRDWRCPYESMDSMSDYHDGTKVGNSLAQSKYQDKVRNNDGSPLEANCRPASIAQIVHLNHEGVRPTGDLG